MNILTLLIWTGNQIYQNLQAGETATDVWGAIVLGTLSLAAIEAYRSARHNRRSFGPQHVCGGWAR